MAKTHEEVKGLLGAFALGAVPEDEARTIRDHILGCDECMSEADELSVASHLLLLTTPPEPAPAGFADRVMARAVEGRQAEQEKRGSPRRRPWMGWALAGASLVLAAVFAFGYFSTSSELDRQRTVLASLLRDDGVELRGPSGAVAKAAPSSAGSVFAVDGLQQAPDGHTYQLWYFFDGTPKSAGIFDVDDKGMALVEVDGTLGDVEAVAVTIEPDGGVDSPTGDPVLSSDSA